ncbi:hypothetical protein EXIGLDRAFT_683679 [Exidia glandulosa HHB12029]|uniref:HTH La-type RNA-binding domain-containing protein n=1 Tax=Exidia glandulosa HHB12029 TaxID=1314781 RepID=A0A165CZY8_EXIGL|nr:hypothetical protein EXIGLDRAFT_683679 [Exidia glandulosa HHB12029]
MHLVHDVLIQDRLSMLAPLAEDPATGAGTVKHAGASQHGQVDGPLAVEEEDARLKQLCLRQVEFLFSDSNLPYDKLMWELHAASDNHWVSLDTIARFKRMRKFEQYGRNWLADVLRSSDSLEVNDADTKIRRTEPVVDRGEEQWKRTAYIGGFGEEKWIGELQAPLELFFDQFGPVLAVQLRRYENAQWEKNKWPVPHEFKGSVWVEFPSAVEMNKFVTMEPKPTWKENALIISSKEQYYAQKFAKRGFSESYLDEMRKCNAMDRCFNTFYAFRTVGKSKNPAKGSYKRDLFIEFMGQKLRVWRLGEGVDAPEGGPKLNPDEWQFVKRKDVHHVKSATLLVTVGPSSLCDGNIFTAPRDNLEYLNIRPLPSIERQTTHTAIFCFERPVSDDTLARIRAKVTTTYNCKLEWTRLGFEAEHMLQYARANAAARGALGEYPDTTVESDKAGSKQANRRRMVPRSATREARAKYEDQIEKTLAQLCELQEKVMGQSATKEQTSSWMLDDAGPSNVGLKRKRGDEELMEIDEPQTSHKKSKNLVTPSVSPELTKVEEQKRADEDEDGLGLSTAPE